MKYKINTDVFGGGRIIQELSSVDDDNQVTRLSRWIINTREEAVHQALLKLSWTPPNEVNSVYANCFACLDAKNAGHNYCYNCGKKVEQD